MAGTVHGKVVLGSVLLVFLCALSACSAEGVQHPGAVVVSEGASPTPTGGATAEATARFTLPASCGDLIGADLEADFLAGGSQLLTDQDGSGYSPSLGGVVVSTQKSGTPFSCWYIGDTFESAFEIAVQGQTQAAYDDTLAALELDGSVETTDGDVVTFTDIGTFTDMGDPGNRAATVHVLRPDGWITIASITTGADRIAQINEWLSIVTARVYR